MTDGLTQHSPFTPFVFSAMSETSLVAQLQAYSDHLKTNSEINASDLAWTLQSRRSHFPTKVAFSASTTESLTAKIDVSLASVRQNSGASIGVRTRSKPLTATPRLLGIFTGQGAQWAKMGAQLIRSSEFVRRRIQDLEDSLMALPSSHRPQWHLADELLAGEDTSRVTVSTLLSFN